MRAIITAGMLAIAASTPSAAKTMPSDTAVIPHEADSALDTAVARAMEATGARGLAIATIRNGEVVRVGSYGERNEAGEPLTTDTIMYGASLTKAAFAYMVLHLVDDGIIDLDTTIAAYLPEPLPSYVGEERLYAPWEGLEGDERWRELTPRLLLAHGSGFANFAFLEPDGRLRFHFNPGDRYAYSGEGYMLLQFVLERGLGLDVGDEMRQRVFEPLGMTRTSMMWRDDFAANLADGWILEGEPVPHDERSKVRAAGSMDTTISDVARLAAALVTCEGLSKTSCAELTRPSLPITTAAQFPTLQAEQPEAKRRADLAAGLGVIVFDGPQGTAFVKTGHDESTGNIMLCVPAKRDCVVILSNDVRAEGSFAMLVRHTLGETGAPWNWQYPGMRFVD